jgi:hypothetical protein
MMNEWPHINWVMAAAGKVKWLASVLPHIRLGQGTKTSSGC